MNTHYTVVRLLASLSVLTQALSVLIMGESTGWPSREEPDDGTDT